MDKGQYFNLESFLYPILLQNKETDCRELKPVIHYYFSMNTGETGDINTSKDLGSINQMTIAETNRPFRLLPIVLPRISGKTVLQW